MAKKKTKARKTNPARKRARARKVNPPRRRRRRVNAAAAPRRRRRRAVNAAAPRRRRRRMANPSKRRARRNPSRRRRARREPGHVDDRRDRPRAPRGRGRGIASAWIADGPLATASNAVQNVAVVAEMAGAWYWIENPLIPGRRRRRDRARPGVPDRLRRWRRRSRLRRAWAREHRATMTSLHMGNVRRLLGHGQGDERASSRDGHGRVAQREPSRAPSWRRHRRAPPGHDRRASARAHSLPHVGAHEHAPRSLRLTRRRHVTLKL